MNLSQGCSSSVSELTCHDRRFVDDGTLIGHDKHFSRGSVANIKGDLLGYVVGQTLGLRLGGKIETLWVFNAVAVANDKMKLWHVVALK
jgi:hypothetical protein